MDEAERLKQKVESGEAKTYTEAEKLVENKPDFSVRDIKNLSEELKLRVEAAQKEREKDVEQKLSDRDILIGESKRTEELLEATQETLEYFESMQKLGELTNPDNVKKIEDLRALLKSLEDQQSEIIRKMAVIESTPEVLNKVYDAAKKEEVERTIKQEIEKAHELFDPQIGQLADSIKQLSGRKEFLWDQQAQKKETVLGAWREIGKLFDSAKNLLGEKSRFGYELDEIFRNGRDSEKLKQQLSEARKSLGLFKGKEKAAIDFILSKSSEFKRYDLADQEFSATAQQLEGVKTDETGLAEQYKTIIESSWEKQNEINELTGNNRHDLPSDLSFVLKHNIDSIVSDIKRQPAGWRRSDVEDSKITILRDSLINIEEKAGGVHLIYSSPEQNKKGE